MRGTQRHGRLLSQPHFGRERSVTPTQPLARPGVRPTDAALSVSAAVVGRKPRVIGVDVARGLALIGMIAAHSFETLDENGNPTLAHVLAGGRAATTFVVVAGVSLAFLSGGRTAVRGRDRVAASAGLAVRALLIAAIGLTLGYLGEHNGIEGILPSYGLLFLLAIPLLACSPLLLIGIAAALTAVGPLLIVATADVLSYSAEAVDPTFTTLVHDPGGVLLQLLVTGEYPAVIYLAYLCVGLAIGRLDLRSRRLAWWLLGGGVALAITARVVSSVLLHTLGGLGQLVQQSGEGDDPTAVSTLLWETKPVASWWYLALPAPHSHTPIDIMHTAGVAVAVLGAALLLTRVPALGRALWPLAAAGSMSLTLYSAHLVLLATGVLGDHPVLLFGVMAGGALALASAWRWRFKQGPLEKLVAVPSTATRKGVTLLLARNRHGAAPSRTSPTGRATRAGIQFLVPVACAGVLALAFWAGARSATPPVDGSTVLADTAVSDGSDGSEGRPCPELRRRVQRPNRYHQRPIRPPGRPRHRPPARRLRPATPGATASCPTSSTPSPTRTPTSPRWSPRREPHS